MEAKQDANRFSLDWDVQAVWVQNRSMYVLSDGQDPEAELLTVQDQLGNELQMTRSELLTHHVPVMNATVYKPRYAPVQAYCPQDDSIIETGDKSFAVKSGEALMRETDGSLRIVPRHEFNCKYQFVSAAGATASFP